MERLKLGKSWGDYNYPNLDCTYALNRVKNNERIFIEIDVWKDGIYGVDWYDNIFFTKPPVSERYFETLSDAVVYAEKIWNLLINKQYIWVGKDCYGERLRSFLPFPAWLRVTMSHIDFEDNPYYKH